MRWISFDNSELYINHFIESIENNKNIKVLEVRNCKIGNNGAILLAKMLEGNTLITKVVQLDYNNIGPEGGIALANMLKRNSTITELDLGYNHIIGYEGARAFVSALGVNKTIEKLNITNNNLSCEGTSAVLRTLETNKTMRELVLCGNNKINYAGVDIVNNIMERNDTLSTLYLNLSKLDAKRPELKRLIRYGNSNPTCYEPFFTYSRKRVKRIFALLTTLPPHKAKFFRRKRPSKRIMSHIIMAKPVIKMRRYLFFYHHFSNKFFYLCL